MQRAALGVRAIMLYKTVKASCQLGAAALLAILWPFGLVQRVVDIAHTVTGHVNHGWSLALAEFLVRHATPRALKLTIVALLLDGALTTTEAWALSRGRPWGAWLVVIATGTFLPVEIYEFVRRPRTSRVVIFIANSLIVAYLARRARTEARANHTAPELKDVP